MFTGLIEEIGEIITVRTARDAIHLTLRGRKVVDDMAIGDSISVSGVCLTVVHHSGYEFVADAVHETMAKTTLGSKQSGDRVNLERAMAMGDRFGGHLVAGHVDGVGTVKKIVMDGIARLLTIEAKDEHIKWMVDKGSVAVDGVSLTIASVSETNFTVSVIPHSWQATTLSNLRIRDRVNLECDMLAKYVAKATRMDGARKNSGLTVQSLRDYGFA